jgi:hypothetical protein
MIAPSSGRTVMRVAMYARLGAATMAVLLGLGGASRAQETPAEERCKTLMTIVSGILVEYAGQVSADLISDLQRKIGTEGKCDGPDEYRVWPNTKDREVLGRIRMLISVWDACKKDPSREGCK